MMGLGSDDFPFQLGDFCWFHVNLPGCSKIQEQSQHVVTYIPFPVVYHSQVRAVNLSGCWGC